MKRYTCTCDPMLATTDIYAHSRQVVIELPIWSPDRRRRQRNGLSTSVCIDQCVVDAIKELWSKGIETTGCCCGHNLMPAWVGVHPAWYIDMFELGYEQRPVEVVDGKAMGLYTFYL